MSRRVSGPFEDVTVYLVLNDHGQFGIAYDETDPAKADRETILRNFLTGQYSNALRVVAFNTAEGWSRDVSEDIADELLQRACDADQKSRRGHEAVHRPAREARREAAVRAVGATRHRSPRSGAGRSKDRCVRRKKAPASPGLLEREPAGGGGMGGTSFALTYPLDSQRRQKVQANAFTNCDGFVAPRD
jgi:hypothetical protein